MSALIEGLCNARAFPHQVDTIRVVETHISWVVLTGSRAYKIKKPLNLGFLDYSTLVLRRRCCEEELRVNRRYAPALYLGVVEITASREGPEIGGPGPVLEYAVCMRQFPDGALLSEQLARGESLPASLWRELGADIAAIHAGLPAAGPDDGDGRGTPGKVRDAIAQNFRQIRPYLREAADIDLLNRLEEESWAAFHRNEQCLWQRYEGGRVRECHGDLHLGNIALIEGRAVAFDAIEFNPALSWIDVINELAFLVMDCENRGHREAGFIALNAYLEHCGDYEGLRLLDFFRGYRAMVRAKVSLLGGRAPVVAGSAAHLACQGYLQLAGRYGSAGAAAPFIAITCGVSGSGKSTVAELVAAQAGAIRIRSDVERKRLFGMPPGASSREGGGADIYTAEAGARTFARLADIATGLIGCGLAVIVDATFIRRDHREDFRRLADRLGVSFHILLCDAPLAELQRRVTARQLAASDASEADLAVLEQQLRIAQLPDPATETETLRVGERASARETTDELLRRVGRPRSQRN